MWYHHRLVASITKCLYIAMVSGCLVGAKQSDIATPNQGWQCHVGYLLARRSQQLLHKFDIVFMEKEITSPVCNQANCTGVSQHISQPYTLTVWKILDCGWLSDQTHSTFNVANQMTVSSQGTWQHSSRLCSCWDMCFSCKASNKSFKPAPDCYTCQQLLGRSGEFACRIANELIGQQVKANESVTAGCSLTGKIHRLLPVPCCLWLPSDPGIYPSATNVLLGICSDPIHSKSR